MPHPFETFQPKRDPGAVLADIRDRARRRARRRSAALSASGLVLLALAGVLLRPSRPASPPPPLPEQAPIVTRAWSGGREASVIVFNLNPDCSVIFIQNPQEVVQ